MKLIDKDAVVAEIERLKESGCASPIVICDTLLSFIDSLQEEPMKIRKGCKYRCKNDMRNNDTGKISFIGGKIYLAPEDNTLVSEENGWRCDTSENASNFELVEEPVSIWHDKSEKPERDDLLIKTNDGRIIHRQSINNYGMVKRWAYTSDLLNLDNYCNFGKNLQEESVSEELEDELDSYIKDNFTIDKEQLDRFGLDEKDYMYSMDKSDMLAMVRHFTELQHKKDVVITEDLIATAFANGMADMKQQMMEDAVDGRFSYNPNFKENEFICLEKSDTPEHYLGELVKVIIIKQKEK